MSRTKAVRRIKNTVKEKRKVEVAGHSERKSQTVILRARVRW